MRSIRTRSTCGSSRSSPFPRRHRSASGASASSVKAAEREARQRHPPPASACMSGRRSFSSARPAWMALVIEPGGAAFLAHCSPEMLARAALSLSLKRAVAPERIASLCSGWGLMLAAMMAPLVVAPVRHLCDRSVPRRRTRAIVLFGSGYVAVWMAAGVMLLALAIAARLIVYESYAMVSVGTLIALIWQFSPVKQ